MPYFHYNQTQRHRYYGQFFTSLDLTSSLNSTRLIRTPRDMMISTLLTLAVRRMHVIHGPFIWPNTPRVLQSLIAQCLEHSTGVRGLRIFSLSHGSWHVDHIIHFFTELKIDHLSLYMTPRWYRHFLCPTPPPPTLQCAYWLGLIVSVKHSKKLIITNCFYWRQCIFYKREEKCIIHTASLVRITRMGTTPRYSTMIKCSPGIMVWHRLEKKQKQI